MLCIVNYGSGNLAAIANICKRERIRYGVASTPSDLADATHFLLPGVGAFDPTIGHLRESGMLSALEEQVLQRGKPLLGICVGMHLLADGSEEGEQSGLGWVPGRVAKINVQNLGRGPHLPHMGWNDIEICQADPLLEGIDKEKGFYFLHSYFFDPKYKADILATVQYGEKLPCIVKRGNVYGAQFHPEKSHQNGIRLLRNFVGIS